MSDPVLLIVVILGFLLVAVLVWKSRQTTPPPQIDPQALVLIQQRVEALASELRQTSQESVRHQQTSSFQLSSTVRDVSERIVRLEETSKQILSYSGQLENLQRILTNPKQRGILGEYYLETLLRNVFSPEQYQMQYKFRDGNIVDAVVFVKDKIIPVDSKFSLENYNRLVQEEKPEERARYEKAFINDLKERIKETSKYIRPEEGTLEFAFMFIPHEALYYDLLINKIGAATGDTESILQVAASKYHVMVVSPTSFAAYLQTVLQGLKALQIEEQTQQLQKRIGDLQRHLAQYQQHFDSVGKHLGTVVNQYNLATKDYALIDKDFLRITGQGNAYQPSLVDKPEGDE